MLLFLGSMAVEAKSFIEIGNVFVTDCHAYACQTVEQYEQFAPSDVDEREADIVYNMAYEDCANNK